MNNQMKKGYSSDYIQAKKQNTIYTCIKNDAQLPGNTVNPKKKNGFFYNNLLDVNVPNPCNSSNCSGGVLTNAKSYQLRLDFKRGKYYNHYICTCKTSTYNDIIEPCNITVMEGNSVVNCLCSPCAFN